VDAVGIHGEFQWDVQLKHFCEPKPRLFALFRDA